MIKKSEEPLEFEKKILKAMADNSDVNFELDPSHAENTNRQRADLVDNTNDVDQVLAVDRGDHFKFLPEFDATRLPPGQYTPGLNSDGAAVLLKNYEDGEEDEKEWIDSSYFPIHNYHPNLEEAHETIEAFLGREDHYREHNIDYRQSHCLFGPPGNSKSYFCRYISKKMIDEKEAVVVKVSTITQLDKFCAKVLNELSRCIPERWIVVWLEELAQLYEDNGHQLLTNVLDSPAVRDRILVIATSNNPERLPPNLLRPSRLDFIHPVRPEDNPVSFLPNFYQHLMDEEFPADASEEWVEELSKLPVSHIKESIIWSRTMSRPLSEALDRFKQRQRLIDNNFKSQEQSLGF